MEPIDALLDIVNAGVSSIKATYAAEGISIPSLNKPYMPSSAEDKCMATVDLVVSAALQLIATVRPAPASILLASLGMFDTAAMGTVSQSNISEILREAGPQGMHLRDIGAKAETSPDKIGRVLRYLASRHIFTEVSPDVFANNRLSSVLDTGESAKVIKAEPSKKYEKAGGVAALVEHCADECFKAAAFMPNFFADSQMMLSDEPNATPLNMAFKTPANLFDFYAQPENEFRHIRFGAAMVGTTKLFPPDHILRAFPWGTLKKGSKIVDVGGGIGSSTLVLAKTFRELNFVVQDTPGAIKDGRDYWDHEFPAAITNGQVKLEVHDFFQPQPIKDASVFMLRFILHDWPNSYAKKILTHLRNVAKPSTKVLLVEQILQYPSHKQEFQFDIQKLGIPEQPPFPLIANAGSLTYSMDLQMLNMCNGRERTIGTWMDTVDGTGWKIDEIIPGLLSSIILVPTLAKL